MDPNLPKNFLDSTAAKTIQALIDAHGYTSYLELGCRNNATFNQIACDVKVSVDMNPGGTYAMTTDDYFAQRKERFDVIFVDAGHQHHQVMRDVRNALSVLNEGGTIVMHDCWPFSEKYENVDGRACGTVWRAFVHLRADVGLDAVCGSFDHGVGLVRRGVNPKPLKDLPEMDVLSYKDLKRNLSEWLDLKTWDQVKAWIADRPKLGA